MKININYEEKFTHYRGLNLKGMTDEELEYISSKGVISDKEGRVGKSLCEVLLNKEEFEKLNIQQKPNGIVIHKGGYRINTTVSELVTYLYLKYDKELDVNFREYEISVKLLMGLTNYNVNSGRRII